LSLPATSLPRNTRSDMSLPIRFGDMGVGDLVALADAAHVEVARLAVGSAIRFLITQDARMRVSPRRSSDEDDHVWAVSDYYGHIGAPQAWYTGRRRPRHRNHWVVRARIVVGALICRVRFSRSRRVRTPDKRSLSDASTATSNGGSRTLRARSMVKPSRLLGFLMACPYSYPFLRLLRTSFQSYKHTSLSASTCFASRSSLPHF
jgi:hypothetical protein